MSTKDGGTGGSDGTSGGGPDDGAPDDGAPDDGSTEGDGDDGGTGSLERQICERLSECNLLTAGYSIQHCTDILESCTEELLPSEKTLWNSEVEACLDLAYCQHFGECYLNIDACGIPDDGPGTGDTGGECVDPGGECQVNGDCCGFPDSALCVNFGDYGVRCAATCEENGDCMSDCCLPLEEGGSVCGPADLCE